ncbi:MAG: V-type ATP synthase subunit F [Thermoplasmata archaeon]
MPESSVPSGRTVVIGERELAIGFRLIGLADVREGTPEASAKELARVLAAPEEYALVIASQSIRAHLTETQRAAADASLRPLVVFVPVPGASSEGEGIEALARRVLGISLTASS